MSPTLEQKRAGFALRKVDSVKGGDQKGKFKTQLLKLPARLHNNGLGQTVAFYLAAGGEKPEGQICGWFEEWLRDAAGGAVYAGAGGGKLIDWITGNQTSFGGQERDPALLYRQASVESRALAGWLKRFAEAFIEGEGSDD
jgi:CRISPR/Cas system CMR-associated protein Cmr5 small subunit